ncbi:MAG: hypothetical protein K6F54_02240 [Lachnospiraceae bacterium]|nr:hypothetical protein [Lachnospiraceae bacterium]
MDHEKRTITLEEAKKKLSDMNLIEDFLFTSVLSDKENGKKVAKILLSTFLNREIDVLDMTEQKVFNGLSSNYHGIRLDAYITGVEETNITGNQKATASIYDIEPENKVGEKKNLPRRNRYYSAIIDARNLKTGVNYDKLPELVIITILSFDPFDLGDMYYEANTILKTHPLYPYDDGIRRLFFYTGGTNNISNDNNGKAIADMLRYIQDSHDINVMNDDIRDLDNIVSEVRKSEEVSIEYMKSWELEDYIRREAIDSTKELDAYALIKNMRKLNASDDMILSALINDLNIDSIRSEELLKDSMVVS